MRESTTDSFLKLKKDDHSWLTAKGEIIPFKEMDIWHIYNSFRMLQRHQKFYENEIVIPDQMNERLKEHQEKYPEYWI